MIKFRSKKFSSHILSDAWTGAKIGASGGAIASAVLSRMSFGKKKEAVYGKFDKNGKPIGKPIKFKEKIDIKYNDSPNGSKIKDNLLITAGGTIIGAALGALVGTIKDISEGISRSRTVDARLLGDVVKILKKSGLRENLDFTRDPKRANELKTKVCIVISKYSDDLRLLINTVNDAKLKGITGKISKDVPNGSIKNNTTSDKYNEITLSTISSGADADLIAEIIKQFVSAKYPVYIVEVG